MEQFVKKSFHPEWGTQPLDAFFKVGVNFSDVIHWALLALFVKS